MSSLGRVISGRGRDTHATAVLGGDRAGHPPSSSNDCQELGVGNLAPALVSASGRASQVGDLACGVSNMPGSSRPEEENLEEWQKVARAKYRVRLSGQRSPICFGRSKRTKPITYSSEEEETGADVVGWSTEFPTVAQLPQVETCRLLEIATRHIQISDAERRKCGNIKRSVSGKMKNSNSYVVKIHQTLQDRFKSGDGDSPSVQEAMVQLKAELRVMGLRNKEMAEELALLKKERAKEPRPVATRSESTTPEVQQLIESIKLMTEAFRCNQQHPQQPQQQQQQLRQHPQQQQQQQYLAERRDGPRGGRRTHPPELH
ncbi:numb-like protein [Vespa crabro]|uniref:numb-like protein n=1 Tax=Vespa crabro TaxID=7445 RepID=UPI001F030E47|nr:numb-like protein [Vespa crabro]